MMGSGILKQINSNSTARKLIALLFLRISMAYMDAKRIFEGKCLTKDTKQPSYVVSLLDWLWARTIAAILWPLHLLAKQIIYSKIHTSIGISKAGVSGGGSLSSHVDKFFEAIDIKVQNGYGLTVISRDCCPSSYCNVSSYPLHMEPKESTSSTLKFLMESLV